VVISGVDLTLTPHDVTIYEKNTEKEKKKHDGDFARL
jgi:hypothetical protein